MCWGSQLGNHPLGRCKRQGHVHWANTFIIYLYTHISKHRFASLNSSKFDIAIHYSLVAVQNWSSDIHCRVVPQLASLYTVSLDKITPKHSDDSSTRVSSVTKLHMGSTPHSRCCSHSRLLSRPTSVTTRLTPKPICHGVVTWTPLLEVSQLWILGRSYLHGLQQWYHMKGSIVRMYLVTHKIDANPSRSQWTVEAIKAIPTHKVNEVSSPKRAPESLH